MSKYSGLPGSAVKAESERKPFVVEVYSERNLTFSPIKGRFFTLEEAIKKAEKYTLAHVVTFDGNSKPNVVWEKVSY